MLSAVEAELITAGDEQLRFHSGPPLALRPGPAAVAAVALRRAAVPGSAAAPRA
jgi:hypothetical protein